MRGLWLNFSAKKVMNNIFWKAGYRWRNVNKVFCTFCAAHYDELLKNGPTNSPSGYILSHLFASACFGRHSTIIRVFDIKEYNELQCVCPSKTQFLKCVIQF
jgi:hypothetical protein